MTKKTSNTNVINLGPVAPVGDAEVCLVTMDTTVLVAKINELTQAERITKRLLGELSRELLQHYSESGDVGLINSLLGVDNEGKFRLTPINWRFACQYFLAFIPHTSNWEEIKDNVLKGVGKREPLVFQKKSGNRLKKIGNKLAEWLAVEENNIWVWSATVKVEEVEKDYAAKVTKAVKDALDEEKGGLGVIEVITAVLSGGVSVDQLLKAMAEIPK